ncbi:STAS/SEC14 domain-containing protein [Algoriphagus namhaensis]
MQPYAEIDESAFPIVQIRFTGNKSTDENFQAYLDQTKACYRFEQRLAIIFDATKATIPSFSHQKMQAEWLKENKELMQAYCAGTAYVIPNLAIRTILKAIFALQKQPVPYQVFEFMEEATNWVEKMGLNQ